MDARVAELLGDAGCTKRVLRSEDGRHAGPVRILRIISRMNIGGPALHMQALAALLPSQQFQTLVAIGRPDPAEGDWSDKLDGALVVQVPWMRRSINPILDGLSLLALVRLTLRYRPEIIHTHAAKAGTLGRVAGLLCGGWWRLRGGQRPVLVHTFHGHVLNGYFSSWASRCFTAIERLLAKHSDALIAVSDAVRQELLRFRIGSPARIRVIPLGLALGRFVGQGHAGLSRGMLAAPASCSGGRRLRVAQVGRLVAIKRHDVLIKACALLGDDYACTIAGDGDCKPRLIRQIRALGLEDRIALLGWVQDVAQIYHSSDCVCLTSMNEGTPVSLIEGMAAGLPAVATDVGGVRDLMGPSVEQHASYEIMAHGVLVPPEDPEKLACALRYLAERPEMRAAMGLRARAHVLRCYARERLVEDISSLYTELLRQGAGRCVR